jgi:hypothetical protein
MSDERSRRFMAASRTSETVALTLGGAAGVLLLMATGAYAGTGPEAATPAWVLLIALAGLLSAPFAAAFGAASYVLAVLAETERLP